jgi:hypothetical protein
MACADTGADRTVFLKTCKYYGYGCVSGATWPGGAQKATAAGRRPQAEALPQALHTTACDAQAPQLYRVLGYPIGLGSRDILG